jgi:hypothetical protein
MSDSGSRVRLSDGREFGPADADVLQQWAREGRVPVDASIVSSSGEVIPAPAHPMLAPILGAPPVARPHIAPPAGDGGVSTLIPYKNPPALIGYYTSIASLIPGLGLLLGPVAIVLGIVGFRAYRREPNLKGAAHAWVAIILGALTSFFYWAMALLVVIGLMAGSRR